MNTNINLNINFKNIDIPKVLRWTSWLMVLASLAIVGYVSYYLYSEIGFVIYNDSTATPSMHSSNRLEFDMNKFNTLIQSLEAKSSLPPIENRDNIFD